tara:strand:- start:863 stop:1228 length:366 start_codon:yes stop_codon:yes gene_type:complete
MFIIVPTKGVRFMKYNIILMSFFLSFLFAGENTTSIKVDGMQCSYSCAGKVNSVMQKIDGVKESSVDFTKGIATVTYDENKVKRNDIINNLKKNTNYTIEQANVYQKSGQCGGSKKKETQI